MEVTAFNIYLFGVLLELRHFFEAVIPFAVISGLIVFFATPLMCDMNNDAKVAKTIKKTFLTVLIILFISILGRSLSPSKEIATAMFVVPPVVNNQKVQELPENVLDFVNSWLKENTAKKSSENVF